VPAIWEARACTGDGIVARPFQVELMQTPSSNSVTFIIAAYRCEIAEVSSSVIDISAG